MNDADLKKQISALMSMNAEIDADACLRGLMELKRLRASHQRLVEALRVLTKPKQVGGTTLMDRMRERAYGNDDYYDSLMMEAIERIERLVEVLTACLNQVDGDGCPPNWDEVRAALAQAKP